MLQVIIGPLRIPFLCHMILFIKNVLSIQYLTLLTAISATKYIFIFVRKNTSGQHEDFWCFIINAAALFLSLIFQFAFQFLPGKKPYMFYQCSNPEESVGEPVLQNIQLYLVIVVSLTVFIAVHLRIKLYQLKFLRIDYPAERERIEKITRSTLASFFTMFSVLILFAVGALGSFSLNRIDPPLITKFPYYQLALLHQHFLFLSVTGQLVLSYFVSNAKLRESVYREMKFQLQKFH